MFVFETGQLAGPRYIVNFPTKRHWRGKSRMEDIEAGLDALAQEIEQRNIRSIALPPLGSGLGGLDWSRVRSRIEATLQDFNDCRVVIFEPSGEPAGGRPNRSTNVPRMTPGRAVLVNLMHRYLGGLLDPFVTLLEVHKLMYFMEVAGEPLRAELPEGALRTICREVAVRTKDRRRTFDLGVCRRRRCTRQATRPRPRRRR